MNRIFSVIIFFSLGLSSCAILTESGRNLYYADHLAQSKKYSDAVATYRKILIENPDSYYTADVRYGLAMTYIAYDNPQKDYTQALQELETFLKLTPNDGRVPEVQNWIAALRTLKQLERLDIRHEERRRK